MPPSGDGNGFATAYPDDFAVLAGHGLTHLRLTLEWARLEPRAGHRDDAAIEHQIQVLTAARDAGIKVWAGLYHYTLPGWFADDAHGFIDDRARTYFWPRHIDFVAETFGDLVEGWMPVNEPTSCAYGGWMSGEIPPGRQDPETFPKALRALHLAGLEAWRLLRSGDRPVATVMNLSPVYPAVRSREPDERDAAGAAAARFDSIVFTTWIRALRDGILAIPGLPDEPIDEFAGAYDLIGFAYDDALSIYADGSVGPYPADARVGPLGEAPWPEGLGVVLRRLHEELPSRPLLVAVVERRDTHDRSRPGRVAPPGPRCRAARGRARHRRRRAPQGLLPRRRRRRLRVGCRLRRATRPLHRGPPPEAERRPGGRLGARPPRRPHDLSRRSGLRPPPSPRSSVSARARGAIGWSGGRRAGKELARQRPATPPGATLPNGEGDPRDPTTHGSTARDTPLRRDRAQRHQRARHAIEAATPARDEHVIDLTDPLQPVESFPPHLAPAEITPDAVAERLRSAGCVLLEGLIPRPAVDGLIASIDRAFAGYDQHDGRPAANDPWFDAFIPKPSIVHATRSWLRASGGLFAVDSPNTFGCWFQLLEEAGMTDLVEALFGEMPVTSLDKCSLRRVGPAEGIEWHQDGAFLGLDVGALNLWVSLSDTATSRGLDLLGRRCTEIVETGTGSAGVPLVGLPGPRGRDGRRLTHHPPPLPPRRRAALRRAAPAPDVAPDAGHGRHPVRDRDVVLPSQPVPRSPGGPHRVLTRGVARPADRVGSAQNWK